MKEKKNGRNDALVVLMLWNVITTFCFLILNPDPTKGMSISCCSFFARNDPIVTRMSTTMIRRVHIAANGHGYLPFYQWIRTASAYDGWMRWDGWLLDPLGWMAWCIEHCRERLLSKDSLQDGQNRPHNLLLKLLWHQNEEREMKNSNGEKNGHNLCSSLRTCNAQITRRRWKISIEKTGAQEKCQVISVQPAAVRNKIHALIVGHLYSLFVKPILIHTFHSFGWFGASAISIRCHALLFFKKYYF